LSCKEIIFGVSFLVNLVVISGSRGLSFDLNWCLFCTDAFGPVSARAVFIACAVILIAASFIHNLSVLDLLEVKISAFAFSGEAEALVFAVGNTDQVSLTSVVTDARPGLGKT